MEPEAIGASRLRQLSWERGSYMAALVPLDAKEPVMGLGKKAKNKAKTVKGKTKKVRQGQAQREESQECREALTRSPQFYYRL